MQTECIYDCTPRLVHSGGLRTSRFTGKERDPETGLDYFGARYFSSSLVRFMTADEPLVFAHAGDPQSWNLYSYGRNNPIAYQDPDGHEYQVCSSGGACGPVDDTTFEDEESQDSKNGETFQNGQIYHYDSDGNRVNDGTYEYEGPDISPFAQSALGGAGRLAAPGVNFAVAGVTAFGYMVSAPAMVAAECIAGSSGCSRGNLAMALLPEVAALREGATLVRAGRGLHAAEMLEKAGGFAEATKDFESLKGSEQSIGNVRVKQLTDGTKAVLRDFSKDGRPTLEIQHPSGEVTKYRYN